MALCTRLQECCPQGRWRKRPESHVERHPNRSFGAPLGSFWVSLGFIAGPFVSFGFSLGDPSGVLWNPLDSSGAASGILWSPLGFFVGILLGSFGGPLGGPLVIWDSLREQAGTKGEQHGDQLGPSGNQMRPRGNQVWTIWDQVGAKWDLVETTWDLVGTNLDQVGTKLNQVGTKSDQVRTKCLRMTLNVPCKNRLRNTLTSTSCQQPENSPQFRRKSTHVHKLLKSSSPNLMTETLCAALPIPIKHIVSSAHAAWPIF